MFMRIDEHQLRELSAAIVRERADLLTGMFPPFPTESGRVKWWLWGWSMLDPRRRRALVAAADRSRKQMSELLSRVIGTDAKAAELEIRALTLQVNSLWAEASKWEGHGSLKGEMSGPGELSADDTPAGFAPAVEALLGFYFGERRGGSTLVAEAQLAYIAMKGLPALTLSRKVRTRRRRAHERYSELWEAWAKSSGVDTATGDGR